MLRNSPIKRGGWVAGLLVSVLLTGCGYQLKGQFRPAEELSPLVWQTDADAEDLYLTIRDTFSLYGLVLDTDPADTLLQVHWVRQSDVTFPEAKMLALEVEWSLVNAQGRPLIDHGRTRAETRLAHSPDVDEDEARLERLEFLRNRVALSMLDQLEAITADDLNRKPDDLQ